MEHSRWIFRYAVVRLISYATKKWASTLNEEGNAKVSFSRPKIWLLAIGEECKMIGFLLVLLQLTANTNVFDPFPWFVSKIFQQSCCQVSARKNSNDDQDVTSIPNVADDDATPPANHGMAMTNESWNEIHHHQHSVVEDKTLHHPPHPMDPFIPCEAFCHHPPIKSCLTQPMLPGMTLFWIKSIPKPISINFIVCKW